MTAMAHNFLIQKKHPAAAKMFAQLVEVMFCYVLFCSVLCLYWPHKNLISHTTKFDFFSVFVKKILIQLYYLYSVSRQSVLLCSVLFWCKFNSILPFLFAPASALFERGGPVQAAQHAQSARSALLQDAKAKKGEWVRSQTILFFPRQISL